MKEAKFNINSLIKKLDKEQTILIDPICINCAKEIIDIIEQKYPYYFVTLTGVDGMYSLLLRCE